MRGFAGRRLCIATMHGKETVIAPVLEAVLGVHCELPPGEFDSDRFGAFDRTVARVGDAFAAARAKARHAMQLADVDMVVASEGTFAPHPDAPILQVGCELLLLLDRNAGLEIHAMDVTTATNHARRRCASLAEAEAFAARIGFPEHGLLVALGEPPTWVRKGIRTAAALRAAIDECAATAERLGTEWFVESDMRAMHNPTRMQSIARAAAALAARVTTPCPACERPGFGRVEVLRGLPCGLCGEPTAGVIGEVFGCDGCGERRAHGRSDGVEVADPGSCPQCNP